MQRQVQQPTTGSETARDKRAQQRDQRRGDAEQQAAKAARHHQNQTATQAANEQAAASTAAPDSNTPTPLLNSASPNHMSTLKSLLPPDFPSHPDDIGPEQFEKLLAEAVAGRAITQDPKLSTYLQASHAHKTLMATLPKSRRLSHAVMGYAVQQLFPNSENSAAFISTGFSFYANMIAMNVPIALAILGYDRQAKELTDAMVAKQQIPANTAALHLAWGRYYRLGNAAFTEGDSPNPLGLDLRLTVLMLRQQQNGAPLEQDQDAIATCLAELGDNFYSGDGSFNHHSLHHFVALLLMAYHFDVSSATKRMLEDKLFDSAQGDDQFKCRTLVALIKITESRSTMAKKKLTTAHQEVFDEPPTHPYYLFSEQVVTIFRAICADFDYNNPDDPLQLVLTRAERFNHEDRPTPELKPSDSVAETPGKPPQTTSGPLPPEAPLTPSANDATTHQIAVSPAAQRKDGADQDVTPLTIADVLRANTTPSEQQRTHAKWLCTVAIQGCSLANEETFITIIHAAIDNIGKPSAALGAPVAMNIFDFNRAKTACLTSLAQPNQLDHDSTAAISSALQQLGC